MNIKCRVCLAFSEAKMYHSLSSAFPIFLKSDYSVLNVLQKVTSSTILINPGWPNEICTACLKMLRECHIFIEEFHKAQETLNAMFMKTAERIVVKIEPPDENVSDPLEITNSEMISYSHSNLDFNQTQQLVVPKVAQIKRSVTKQGLIKSKRSKKTSKENKTVVLPGVGKKNKIKVRKLKFMSISDHTYTKDPNYEIQDYELDSEESNFGDNVENINNLNLGETIKVVNAESISNEESPSPNDNIYVMSINDVLKIKQRVKKTPSSPAKPRPDVKKPTKTDPSKNQTKKWVNLLQFQCSMCPKSFATARGLTLHHFVHTRVHTPQYTEELKCMLCGYQCTSKNGLVYHRKKHRGLTYKCDECDKLFRSKWQVTEHKRRMHDGLPEKFMCNECGKTFKYSAHFKYHMVAVHHKDEKEYLCGFCGFKCVTTAQLKRHERCHTDERPYKCKFCPKMFRGSPELQLHHMVHEQKSKFYCKYCGKGFITSWNMKVHWLQHNGSHKCNFCSKAFVDDDVLKFHCYCRHKNTDTKKNDENIKIQEDIMDGGLLDDFAIDGHFLQVAT